MGEAEAFEVKVASQARAIETLAKVLAKEGAHGLAAANIVLANDVSHPTMKKEVACCHEIDLLI